MNDIIKNVSTEIAKEIITRPNFDLQEITGIINFRLKESILDILLSNVEKEEVNYHKLLLEQSKNRPGSKQYVELGYKLSIAKNKKAIANRAVNNVKNRNKISICLNFIKQNYGFEALDKLHKIFDEREVNNG